MSYYHRFKLLSIFPLWKSSLQTAYAHGVSDLKMLKTSVDFSKKNFTCLLCGVSGEKTAEAFILFMLQKNERAHIKIIDLGEDQVQAVRHLVREKYKNYNIEVEQANALELTHIKNNSIDWIETDGFLEFFIPQNLNRLLKEWKRILSPEGFITTREFASEDSLGKIIDIIRIWLGKTILAAQFHLHTRKSLETIFKKNSLRFYSKATPIPTYRRYTLIKE